MNAFDCRTARPPPPPTQSSVQTSYGHPTQSHALLGFSCGLGMGQQLSKSCFCFASRHVTSLTGLIPRVFFFRGTISISMGPGYESRGASCSPQVPSPLSDTQDGKGQHAMDWRASNMRMCETRGTQNKMSCSLRFPFTLKKLTATC